MNNQVPNIPTGLSMAFSQNVDSVDYFASLSPDEQQDILKNSHLLKSTENGNNEDFKENQKFF